MSFLLDTNVISELRKGPRSNEGVFRWFSSLSDDDIFLSVLVIGEIRRGIERIRRRDSKSARSLEGWLKKLVSAYGDRILPIDRDVAEEWGRAGTGGPVPVVDGLIAATAKVHGLTLATRNIRDVARTGVAAVNPWETA